MKKIKMKNEDKWRIEIPFRYAPIFFHFVEILQLYSITIQRCFQTTAKLCDSQRDKKRLEKIGRINNKKQLAFASSAT